MGVSTVSIQSVRLSYIEATTQFSYLVTRSGDLSEPIRVDWRVQRDHDLSPSGPHFLDFSGNYFNELSQYDLPLGRLYFSPGETSKYISFNSVDERAAEKNESFIVRLSNPPWYEEEVYFDIDNAISYGTIIDNGADVDVRSAISIAAVTKVAGEGQSGATPFIFALTRTGYVGDTRTVNYAASGFMPSLTEEDFVGGVMPSGVVTFLPGQSQQLLAINVAGDTLVEEPERFQVTLSGASANTSLGTATATAEIQNDDGPGASTLSVWALDAFKPEGTGGTTAFRFLVQRIGDLSQADAAGWSVSGGVQPGTVAANAADFTASTGNVTFAAGVSEVELLVQVLGDFQNELNESFLVSLSSSLPGVSFAPATATGVILNDDALGSGVLSIVSKNATVAEGDSGVSTVPFTITRSGDTTLGAQATWRVGSGSYSGRLAADPSDFGLGPLPSGMARASPRPSSPGRWRSRA